MTASEWAVKDQIMQVITDVIGVYNDLHFAQENLEVAKRSQGLAGAPCVGQLLLVRR